METTGKSELLAIVEVSRYSLSSLDLSEGYADIPSLSASPAPFQPSDSSDKWHIRGTHSQRSCHGILSSQPVPIAKPSSHDFDEAVGLSKLDFRFGVSISDCTAIVLTLLQLVGRNPGAY